MTLSLLQLVLTETAGCEQSFWLTTELPCLRVSLCSNKYDTVCPCTGNALGSPGFPHAGHCTTIAQINHTNLGSLQSLGQDRSPAFSRPWAVKLRPLPLEYHIWNQACKPTSWKIAPEYGETPKSSRANPSTTETDKTPALEPCNVGGERSHDGKNTDTLRTSHWMSDTKPPRANSQPELICPQLCLPCTFLHGHSPPIYLFQLKMF